LLAGSILSAEMGQAYRSSQNQFNLTSRPKLADDGRFTGRKVMATVSRTLPRQPHLDIPKRQARELLKQCRAGDAGAFERVRRRHPKLHHAADAVLQSAAFRLSDAQLVVAREYEFSSWTQLKERISAHTIAGALDAAIR